MRRNSGKPGICVSCDRADDGLSGSFWYEMDGAPAGCTCLPEAGRGDCDSCRRWHGEHDEGSLPQYVFLGLSADLPHGICCQGSEAIRDPGRYPEEDPPGDRPDGSKDPKKSCPIQTNTQDPHVVFDDTLDAQSILEVRAGLWLLGRTWMAR